MIQPKSNGENEQLGNHWAPALVVCMSKKPGMTSKGHWTDADLFVSFISREFISYTFGLCFIL